MKRPEQIFEASLLSIRVATSNSEIFKSIPLRNDNFPAGIFCESRHDNERVLSLLNNLYLCRVAVKVTNSLLTLCLFSIFCSLMNEDKVQKENIFQSKNIIMAQQKICFCSSNFSSVVKEEIPQEVFKQFLVAKSFILSSMRRSHKFIRGNLTRGWKQRILFFFIDTSNEAYFTLSKTFKLPRTTKAFK